jgi:coenzyme F420-reducing hydrogenase beta subunit
LLQRKDPVIAERVRFCLGLVCGHLKSQRYAESIGWQAGIAPSELKAINFRVKLDKSTVSDYGVAVSNGIHTVTRPRRELVGTNWGLGAFKYAACDTCDDLYAETADLSLGDAWLPELKSDFKGNNVIVTRHPTLLDLVAEGRASGALQLKETDARSARKAQEGGLRHRRDGLKIRLRMRRDMGEWSPKKRVKPALVLMWSKVSLAREHEARRLRILSHNAYKEALSSGDLTSFTDKLDVLPPAALFRPRRLSIENLVGKVKRLIRGF